jgi:hypothetical protein
MLIPTDKTKAHGFPQAPFITDPIPICVLYYAASVLNVKYT